tara:strand:+ start:56 stop:688 length:633 start_codon:yes stop_codon:yes gene_type:complete
MDTSMNKAMSDIDNITLSCFANKSQYDTILKKNEYENSKQYNSDAKFYKKRILDLTKKLFRNGDEHIIDAQLNKCFISYIKSCINYLKFLDKSDIIQKKYENEMNLNDDNNNDLIDKSISTHSESKNDNDVESLDTMYAKCDHLFSKPEEVKKVTLDNYVIKSNGAIKPKILPKKEEINIKTKEHKRKGISKKKNIKNIYEDTKNEKKQN